MDIKKTPLAVAIFAEIISIVCALSIYLLPSFSQKIFQSFFHGIDLSAVWDPTFNLGSFILGIVVMFVGVYAATWLFVVIYKAIVK
jgi:hypothetical protein